MTNIQRTEVGGLVDAQTEARAIAWRGEYKQPGTDRWIVRYVDDDKPAGNNWRNVSPLFDATALAAKDVELAAVKGEIDRCLVARDEAGIFPATPFETIAILTAERDAAEAQLDKARKALEEIADARAELNSPHDYSRGWNDALFRVRQIARRELTGGQEDG